MRSRRLEAVLAALLWLAGCGLAQDAAGNPAPRRADAAAVEAAASALRSDPLLAGTRKTRHLAWKDDAPPRAPEKARPPPGAGWLDALKAFGQFLSDTSRLLVYGLAAVAAAVLLASLHRLVRLRAFSARRDRPGAVSHVRDLDVRPESLPEDIGAAAWRLWLAGDVPGALSLLYRGALSRLIHRHAVPIQAATTEGECLDLAAARVDPAARRYLRLLVRAREASAYGGRTLPAATGESLCKDFAGRLDAPAPAPGEAAR